MALSSVNCSLYVRSTTFHARKQRPTLYVRPECVAEIMSLSESAILFGASSQCYSVPGVTMNVVVRWTHSHKFDCNEKVNST